MQKRKISPNQADTNMQGEEWLNPDHLKEVEITSEDPEYPIEGALRFNQGPGWRANEKGAQTIRIIFADPQPLKRVWLRFVETVHTRTQEFVLRWSPDGGRSYKEIIRQQWNFSPHGSTEETEDFRVALSGVTALELNIIPDKSGGQARASLSQFLLA